MVKAYLRYAFNKPVGLIAGHASNVLCRDDMLVSGNSQYVQVLDSITGEVSQILFEKNKNSEVTTLALSNASNVAVILAAGFMDGDVVLWNWEDFSYKCNLNGHKSAVTHIVFNHDASQLISGSGDTSLIVWDILGEQALYRLSGHKNAITDLIYHKFKASELVEYDFVLSSSKDGLLKVWDLQIACSVQTVSSLSNEVSSMVLLPKDNLLLLSTNNDDVLILKLSVQIDPTTNQKQFIQHIATFKKQSFSKPLEMKLSHTQEFLFMLTTDKTIEVYKILSGEQLEKKQKRKQKKLKKKQGQENTGEGMEIEETAKEEEIVEEPNVVASITDRLQYHTTFRLPKKARSICFFSQEQKNKINHDLFAVGYHNNNVELYSFATNPQTSYLENKELRSFNNLGHRQAIRALALSDNDNFLVSGGGESLKLWSTENMESLRTFETGNITAARFLPRNRFFLAADKEGTLYLIDIPKGEIIQTIEGAHEASIWSIDYHENPHGFESIVIITGGADRKLKFWELVLSAETKLLQLQELKTLYMKEEVLCAKYAPNGYHYAVSLLDNSIEINFSDSDKLFLQFYGHKLPVTCFDISSDNTLLLSGSADKNVKLWGMDYGNCHKSIFAHQDAVTCVKFVKDTHYFFTGGKDRVVKYWDGDSYKLVMQFDECFGEVWAIAVSQIGDFFITGSGDKIIRLWKQSKEQVFVEEEEEKRMEKMMIEDYAEDQLKRENDESQKKALQNKEMETSEVIKKKFENLKYGEEIMAAIDQAEEMREQQINYEQELAAYQKNIHKSKDILEPQKPDMQQLFGLTIPEYVLTVVNRIKATELENSMKFLHTNYIEKLLYYLNFYVTNNINTELASRILFFILHTHETHILNSKKLVTLLLSIQKHLRKNIQAQRDLIGVNLAAISFIKNDLQTRKTDNIFSDDIFTQRSSLF